ncbi:MAG: riboflavin synthase [Calditrichaeota bacterium]|nr:riboflavin synthase [Candidatus Cloacimonadota bacterium]MCB1046376.1 riboflavin synthase [Calditrichota bacterium]MCB9474298.1 riboflavin synthase [Candidatus Delongbacteria bacterium]
MFTGIVEETGVLASSTVEGQGRRLVISAARVLEGLKIEDSIAVNGVCLTVVRIDGQQFQLQAVAETLAKTSLGNLRTGSKVNLERALTPSTRIGGHYVQGHVDCVGRLAAIRAEHPGKRFVLEFPREYSRYVARTGSIAIEGVSLTVAATTAGSAEIALIPHTLDNTTLGALRAGDPVNLEFDCLAKYVEQLLLHGLEPAGRAAGGSLSEQRLRELGY